MSDSQFHALVAQVQAIADQIQTESRERVVADEALAVRVCAFEAAFSAMKLQYGAEVGNAAGEKILLERRIAALEQRLAG